MITINHLSFDFVTADEPFAHNLYADWDSFCHACIEKVVDECFSAYDKDKVLYEIERLDLDLGVIPEDDFYKEFPFRLREELLKSLPMWNIQSESQKKKTEAYRLENLLFYLEHGYQKAEWMDADFNLTEELEWAVVQPEVYTEKIIPLCLSKEHVLRRVLWQTDDETILLHIYTISLFRPSVSLYEKRRFLGMLLDTNPAIPIRFIHEAKDDMQLHDMAELLDTLSVRQIMVTETREHAEVDLPPYWHYLYEWLVRYYPFDGLAIFGGKNEFIRHLHHRLLTFIRKRNYSFYLSKEDLTVGFLLEVFGQTYYKEVLNAIYDLQPLQADGSPVYDGYLNRELYRMFLRLSLLRLPAATQLFHLLDVAALTVFLKDSHRSNVDKRMLLTLLAKERPAFFIEWLRTEAIKEVALVTFIAEATNDATINRLLASVSFTAIERVAEITAYLQNFIKRTGLLNGIPETLLSLAMHKAVLLWIGNSYSNLSEPESIRQLLRLISWEITGNDNEEVIEVWLVELYISEKEGKQSNLLLNTGIYTGHSVQIDFKEWLQLSKKDSDTIQMLLESHWNSLDGFISWLEDTSVSTDRKRELLRKAVVEKPQKWISLLHKLPEASKAVSLVAGYLSIRSMLQGMGKTCFHQAAVLSQTVEWLGYKANDFPFLTRGNITLSSALPQALLLYMQDKDTLGGRTLTEQEAIQKFLSFLYLVYTGKSDYRNNVEWTGLSNQIVAKANRNNVQNLENKDVAENKEITRNKEIGELSDITQPEIIRKRWLRDYLCCRPKELLDYIRLSITQNIIPLDKWLEWLDINDWMRLVASLSLSNAELLQQITDCLLENSQAGEIDLRTALAAYIIENHVETYMYNNRNETIHSFVQSFPFKNKKEMDLKVEEVLRIMENYPKEEMQTGVSENFHVNNAGLCLFAPWLLRLMQLCDLLDEQRKSFKSDLSRLHAVFLLQYLTCSQEREYAETELVFNRMLVGLPMHLPLPKRLELTAKEKEMADSMLEGVKSNWTHMRNTSMAGFQQNFIVRGGQLVQEDERWLLTVEDRSIDILLDSIPWPFKQIHLPWLKKNLQVHWREK